MTVYQHCLSVEERGEAMLLPFLNAWSAGAPLQKIPKGWIPQRRGDFVVTTRSMVEISVDMKAIDGVYQEFFFETWSHKRIGREGWVWTSNANRIAWLYMPSRELFIFDLPKLREWLRSNLDRFEEKPQTKYEQKNDAWGRCVPRDVFESEVGYVWSGKLLEPAELLEEIKRAAVAAYKERPGDETWRAAAEATKAANGGKWP